MRQFYLLLVLLTIGGLPRLAHAAAPVITRQPTNQTTTVGQPVTFSVTATGTATLYYQWRRASTDILNATNFNYTLPGAQAVDNGEQFSVVITNGSGSVTSAVVVLTVLADNTPPTVVKVSNAINFMQITVAFSERVTAVSASDSANYTLDQGGVVNGAALQGSGRDVVLTVDALMEGTNYTLSVSDIYDLAGNLIQPNPTSVMFQAAVPPFITTQPHNNSVNPGDASGFSVEAAGTAPLTYLWYKGLSPLAGQTMPTLDFPSVQASNVGFYRVVVGNSAGSVTSVVARLSFFESYTLDLPAGYSFVANQLYNPNQGFPVPPNGTTAQKWNGAGQSYGPVLNYVSGAGWMQPGVGLVSLNVAPGEGVLVNLPMATNLVFTGDRITPMLPVTLGNGLSLVSAQVPIVAGYGDIVGTPQEGSAVYKYIPGSDPTNQNAFRFSYFRDGMWRDHPPVVNVGESVFATLITPVTITTQPAAQTNLPIGTNVTFFVTASGTGPLSYQWRLNGTAIPGATSSNYVIQSVNPGHAGLYSVSVGNDVGDINSLNAPLTIRTNDAPFFNMTDDFASQGSFNNSFGHLLSSHNRNATIETNEPPHAGKRAGASVWVTWVAPAPGIVTMSTAGSGFDTILAAYRGPNVTSLTPVDASDDEAGYACSLIRFNVQAGFAYRICVAGLGAETGDILLGWNLEVTTAVVPDIIAQPQDLTLGYGDTAQFTVTTANGTNYQWFHDGVPIDGASFATLSITNVGDADVGNYFVHVFNASNPARFRDSLNASLQIEVPEPGQAITGARAAAKFFDVLISGGGSGLVKAPPHKLGGTVNHGYSGAQVVSSVGVGKDPGEPNHAGFAGGNSIWYTVQSTNNGTLYVNTDGSSFDTVVAAYIGPGNSYLTLTNVAADNNSGIDGLDSSKGFTATSNTIYYLAVDGVGGASGTVKLAFHLVRPLLLTNLVYSAAAGGSITMKVITTPSLTNIIQYRTNLTSTNWVSVLTNTSASGTFNYTNTGIGAIPNRYYRGFNRF